MKSGHFFEWSRAVWVKPLLMMGFFSLALLLLKWLFKDYLQDWGFAMNREDIEVEEGNPNFFEAVKLTASVELISEN